MAVKAIRSLMKLAQIKSPGELGVRAEKLTALAFSEEVKDNVAIQNQLSDLYVEALHSGHIRHDVIKEASIKLSVAIVLAKYSERI